MHRHRPDEVRRKLLSTGSFDRHQCLKRGKHRDPRLWKLQGQEAKGAWRETPDRRAGDGRRALGSLFKVKEVKSWSTKTAEGPALMALAKLVCGDCGGALAQSDVRCQSCGHRSKGGSSRPQAACSVCGQSNAPGTEFCRSAGPVSLPVRAASGKRRSPQSRRGGRMGAGKNVGVWQIISAVAVIALLSYLSTCRSAGEILHAAAAPSGAEQGRRRFPASACNRSI